MEATVCRCPINDVGRPPDIIPNCRHLAQRLYVDDRLIINTSSGFAALVISIHTPKTYPVVELGHLDQYHADFLDFFLRLLLGYSG